MNRGNEHKDALKNRNPESKDWLKKIIWHSLFIVFAGACVLAKGKWLGCERVGELKREKK